MFGYLGVRLLGMEIDFCRFFVFVGIIVLDGIDLEMLKEEIVIWLIIE